MLFKSKKEGHVKIVAEDRTVAVSSEVVEDQHNKVKIQWTITDLPGQAEYYATNSLFLSLRNTVVLMVIRLWPIQSSPPPPIPTPVCG